MRFKKLFPLLAGFGLLLCTNLVNAHADFRNKLEMLNHQIEHKPKDQNSYILRGRTYSDKNKYALAMDDFGKAEKLGNPVNVTFDLGVLHYRANEFAQAKNYFDRYLNEFPNHPASLEYRARLLRDAGDYRASLADFEHYFELRKNPDPGYYISTAQMLLVLPDKGIPAAIDKLDQGIQKLGINPQLQYFAVELELRRKNYDQAIARMQALKPMLGDSPKWKTDFGKIQLQAGDKSAAHKLFSNAKTQLLTLRKTPARTELLAELELLLTLPLKK